MKFAVIGGDMRQAKLSELLRADGHTVSAFAIDKIRLEGGVVQTDHTKEAAEGADCVILPLPMSSEKGLISAPLSAGPHTTRETLSVLRPEQIICAGKIGAAEYELSGTLGLNLTDYLQREELAVLNAAAAAEGALQLIMEETAITVWRSKVLVLGFGRIARLLCHRLRGLGAAVTATARTYADLAWINAYGYEAIETGALDGKLGGFDAVVNTVPARVLGEARLRELKPGCLCLDLASKPGGLDFSAAAELGVKALWALGLPGEVAPVTSGAIIRDTVYNILREKGFVIP